MIFFPKINEPFYHCVGTLNVRIEGILAQNRKFLAVQSEKLAETQNKYHVTDKTATFKLILKGIQQRDKRH